MKKILIFSALLGLIFLLAGFSSSNSEIEINPNSSVSKIAQALGAAPSLHELDYDEDMVRMGKELVIKGKTRGPNGRKTRQQSKHFKCISCHNVVKEDPDLAIADPQARLQFAKENQLSFLQGTTFYGAVNRSTFYNGDYQKKYDGNPRILKSHKDLREAIQLCAVECAQGRPMKKWELDAVLAYYWSLELKVKDLNLSASEMEIIKQTEKGKNNSEALKIIESKYLKASPATFGITPKDAKAGFSNITGHPENGKLIYDLSCLHCHEAKKYAMYELDDDKMTFQHLRRHIPKYDRYSIYQVSRYGAPSYAGKRAYMPQYPIEKLTDQQLEDLRAYVDLRAKR